ncbi:hypothetical protein [Leucobacter sp. 1207-22]|uniref:hypothetical protein n=1 Tax=Leucobacter sp. 1207-22 TaxID=2604456 RepID=UPI0040644D0D
MAEGQKSRAGSEQSLDRHGRPLPVGGGKQAATRSRIVAAVVVIVLALLVGVGGVLLLSQTPVTNSGSFGGFVPTLTVGLLL